MPEETGVYDVIIVGAGPVGLAVAARIREDTPAAIFTDEEHRRYKWLRKYGRGVSIKQYKTGKEVRFTRRSSDSSDTGSDTDSLQTSRQPDRQTANARVPTSRTRMLVVDESDNKWLGRWDRLFGAYCITHLRSPLLWHVDPQDRDSLLARAHEQGVPEDLFDVGACVGKEISKHLKKKRGARRGGIQDSQPNVDINERERNDYFTPSRKLFYDHCHCVSDRYGLDGRIMCQESLCNIDYGEVRGVSIDGEKLFTITTNRKRRYARIVILAVGPANAAKIPWIPGLPENLKPMGSMPDSMHSTANKMKPAASSTMGSQEVCPQASHTFHLTRVPDPLVESRIRTRGQTTNVLVVGGGLTSAQIADLCLRRGVTRVWHLMRGVVVVKYFDVGLNWMGKYRNREQARFWSADSDEERFEMIKEARGGGSITPHFNRILKKHVASGHVQLHTRTVVTKLRFVEGETRARAEAALDAEVRAEAEASKAEAEGKENSASAAAAAGPKTSPGEAPHPGYWKVTTEPAIPDMPLMDYIYFATGIETDVAQLPYLQTMLKRFPIDTVGGFPCLTEDLMWTDDVPLFCAGKLACLRIGPVSPNIGGGKYAAERIGLAVDQVLRRNGVRGGWEYGDVDSEGGTVTTDYVSGVGSKYRCLEDVDW